MSVKTFLRDYLNFSRKDRMGLICLLALIVIINLVPLFLKNRGPKPQLLETKVLQSAMDTLEQRESSRKKVFKERGFTNTNAPLTEELPGERFVFDPNTLSMEGWKRLGLSGRTIKTLMNYRAKGGKFYKPEDLSRIWGLPEGFYESVRDYIQIAGKEQRSGFEVSHRREKTAIVININEADTTAWISLPGIGSKLATRIILFREKLGGFHSVEQVGETYGLADSTFQKIKPLLRSGGTVRKISINTAGKEELKVHPYFKWALANAIVEYRNAHGQFKELEELKKITLMDEKTYEKLLPYLSL